MTFAQQAQCQATCDWQKRRVVIPTQEATSDARDIEETEWRENELAHRRHLENTQLFDSLRQRVRD